MTANNIQPMNRTIRHIILVALLLMMGGTAMAQSTPTYVIMRNDTTSYDPLTITHHFLSHTGSGSTYSLTDATDFNPATCLWFSGPNIEHNYYFIDDNGVSRYLFAPLELNGTLGIAPNPGTVTLNKTAEDFYFYDWDQGVARGVRLNPPDCIPAYNSSGSQCWKVVWLSYESNTWKMSSVYGYDPTPNYANFKSVSVTEHTAQVTPTSGGAPVIADFAMEFVESPHATHPLNGEASPFSYSYVPAYTSYLIDGTTYYFDADGSSLTGAPGTTSVSGASPTSYAWTLTGEGARYLTLSATDIANPILTYQSQNSTSSHKMATLTLTVTYGTGTNQVTETRTATVTVKTSCQNPDQAAAPVVTFEDVTLSWLPSADSYKVEWTSDATWGDTLVEVGNVTSYTIPMSQLKYAKTYQYRVVAKCGDSYLTPTTSNSFTTLAQADVVILGAVYGGGRMADVDGNTEVQMINCDSVMAVYGGNDIAGTVSGKATITLGTTASEKVRVFDVYGGGNGYYAYNGSSFTAASSSFNSYEVPVNGTVNAMTQNGQVGNAVWTNESGAPFTLNFPKIKQTAIVVAANDAIKVDSLFGGAKNAFLTYGNSNYDGDSIAINGGTIYAVFGGNNIGGGQGYGKHHIEVNGTKTNTTTSEGLGRDFGIGYLFGGGNKVYGSTTEVFIYGGQCDTVFAGGNSADVYAANVTVNCSLANTISDAIYSHSTSAIDSIDAAYPWNGTGVYNVRTLFGGNNRAQMNWLPNVTLTSGAVGTVYGGGNAGNMMAQVPGGSITFTDPDFESYNFDYSTKVVMNSPTMLVDNLYGGCQMSNVGYSTWVQVQDGHVGTVYGGCNISGDVGSERVNMSADPNNPDGQYQVVHGATYVEVSGGTVYKDVFAGSNGFYHCLDDFGIAYSNESGIVYDPLGRTYYGEKVPTHNETRVVISGSAVVKNNVYAGGNLAPVGFTTAYVHQTHSSFPYLVGLASVRMIGGTVNGDVYGGGRMASINGSNEVRVTAGTIDGALYGGNDRLGQAGQISNRKLPDTYNTASDNLTPITSIDSHENVNTYVGVTGNPRINTVYGGGNGAYIYSGPGADMQYCDITDLPIQKNIFVDIAINGGNNAGYIENVYGGGNGVYTDGFVKVFLNVRGVTANDSDHVGTIFGGNNMGDMDTIPDIILLHGNVHTVYGGCNSGAMTGVRSYTGDDNTTYNNIGSLVHLRSEYTAGGTTVTPDAKVTGAVYGGCRMNGVTNNHNTLVLVEHGNHPADLFGGSDISGTISGTSNVVVKGGTVGNVYGGGNGNYYYDGNKVYNINDHSILIDTSDVNIAAPICAVSKVDVLGGQVGATGNGNARNIYGGGWGELTSTTGNVTVNIGDASAASAAVTPTIYGDIYGGSALGVVNTNATNTTTVDFLNGTIHGNVYGGGLGYAQMNGNYLDPSPTETPIEAVVNGTVHVNIGDATLSADPTYENYVNIDGKVFGGNNLAGSPQAKVYVDVYRTAHTTGNAYPNPVPAVSELTNDYYDDHAYAIREVYGGGNLANYSPVSNDTSTYVHIHNCDNTIGYVYGGGNAARVPASKVIIDGGLFNYVFGGGNGYGDGNPGANVSDNDTIVLNGGLIGYIYGGSNARGTVYGETSLQFKETPDCNRSVNELYGGGNQAADANGITLNIPCGTDGVKVIYGGANQANVGTSEAPADVVLNVRGGNLDAIYGGNNQSGTIFGKVIVNLYGGTINKVFGGNNQGGLINDTIQVNVIDAENSTCPLNVNTIYGGGNMAAYTPTFTPASGTLRMVPQVNVIHGTINDAVYGGGMGSGATVNANPVVTIGDNNASHKAVVGNMLIDNSGQGDGNVYGGGDAAAVNGSTTVIYQDNHDDSQVNRLFGGGNQASITQNDGATGTATVNMNSGKVLTGIYGGCNTQGTVDGDINVNIYDGTLGTSGSPMTEGIFGGGKGGYESSTNPGTTTTGNVTVTIGDGTTPEIYADVYGGSAFGQVGATGKTAKVELKNGTVHGKVFGGGKGDNSHTAEVTGDAELAISGGSVLDSIFGGCNVQGIVKGDAIVGITGGTLGAAESGTSGDPGYVAEVRSNVYGGGLGQNTKVKGNVAVTVNGTSANIYGDVYGGSAKGLVNCTEEVTPAHNGDSKTDVTLTAGTIHGNLYGGGHGMNNQSANVYGPVAVLVNGGSAITAFGCNNLKGAPQDTVTITVTNGVLKNVCGGGNQAAYIAPTGHADYPAIYIQGGKVTHKVVGGCNAANIGDADHQTNPRVIISGGNICTEPTGAEAGVFGGCNASGTVYGNITLSVTDTHAQTVIGTQAALEALNPVGVYGGGFGDGTATTGNVTVTYGRGGGLGTDSEYPMLYGDLYGGSALGTVNSATASPANTTTVTVLNGSMKYYRVEKVNYGGNIYGGGRGEEGTANAAKGQVNGVVHVNIGEEGATPGTVIGKANLKGCNVFGCNNTNGSPKQEVYVDVYQTHHTAIDSVSATDMGEINYAIRNVYGGGNKAHYAPANEQKTHNTIHECHNTIENVYGGGNAADTWGAVVAVDGGRYKYVFGGGNGQTTPANILDGGVNIAIYGGHIGWYFNGCNLHGSVGGGNPVEQYGCTDTYCPCGDSLIVENYYFGANEALTVGGLSHIINCGDNMNFLNVYAGSRLAVVYGDVKLWVRGGTIGNLYGGNEGSDEVQADVKKYPELGYDWITNPDGHPIEVKQYLDTVPSQYGKGGNIQLVLEGGQLGNVYGGNNFRGNVEGNIVIIVDSTQKTPCELSIDNIYGGNNKAAYTPDSLNHQVHLNPDRISPRVYLKKGHVTHDVYGGSEGGNPLHQFGNGDVVSNSLVVIGDPSNTTKVVRVGGDVFGGGMAATLEGNPVVVLQGKATVEGNVYGGSKQSDVRGTTDVRIAPTTSVTPPETPIPPKHKLEIQIAGSGSVTVKYFDGNAWQEVNTSAASYVINDVPEGSILSIEATPTAAFKDWWTNYGRIEQVTEPKTQCLMGPKDTILKATFN